MAKQNRERKAAKQMMESLGGMQDIKKAEKCEKERKWKECIEHYEKGVEELEKSLSTLQVAKILSEFQVQQCQQQIDAYCRNLIKLQRAHSKDIARESRREKKRASLTKFTNKNKAKAKSTEFTDEGLVQDAPVREVDENDESAVFGGKKKRESAVSLKRKEMARMQREMDTGKVERPGAEEDEKGAEKEKEDDMFSIYDRSAEVKKHKEKMSAETPKKKKKGKEKEKDKKDKGKKGKKKRKDSGDGDDDEKEDKKKSKASK